MARPSTVVYDVGKVKAITSKLQPPITVIGAKCLANTALVVFHASLSTKVVKDGVVVVAVKSSLVAVPKGEGIIQWDRQHKARLAAPKLSAGTTVPICMALQ